LLGRGETFVGGRRRKRGVGKSEDSIAVQLHLEPAFIHSRRASTV